MITFEEAHVRAAPFTIVPAGRCALLWDEARRAPDGDFAEVGVYRGGTAMLLRMAAPARRLHLFDTFAGHPDVAGEFDSAKHHSGRFHDTDVESVRQRVGGRLSVWIGRFPDPITAGHWNPPLALVHIDVDLYRSTLDVCKLLIPLLVLGGAAICDDYSDDDCPGATRAIDEYAAAHASILDFTVAPTGQAFLRRR